MKRILSPILVIAIAVLLAVPFVQLSSSSAQDSAAAGGSLPLYGLIEAEDGTMSAFQGSVTDLVVRDDGGMVLDGLLSGLVISEDEAIRVTDQEFSSPVTPSVTGSIDAEDYDSGATPAADSVGALPKSAQDAQTEPDEGRCDVLFLDIQPITLNLLGLEVLTSRITLDINAIPGDGNLLGNLICSLAGLLDGTPDAISEITDQLNEVLAGATSGTTSAAPSASADASSFTDSSTSPEASSSSAPSVEASVDPSAQPSADASTVPVDETPAGTPAA